MINTGYGTPKEYEFKFVVVSPLNSELMEQLKGYEDWEVVAVTPDGYSSNMQYILLRRKKR